MTVMSLTKRFVALMVALLVVASFSGVGLAESSMEAGETFTVLGTGNTENVTVEYIPEDNRSLDNWVAISSLFGPNIVVNASSKTWNMTILLHELGHQQGYQHITGTDYEGCHDMCVMSYTGAVVIEEEGNLTNVTMDIARQYEPYYVMDGIKDSDLSFAISLWAEGDLTDKQLGYLITQWADGDHDEYIIFLPHDSVPVEQQEGGEYAFIYGAPSDVNPGDEGPGLASEE